MSKVYFSIFYHYPSIIAKECIVLGVLAYNPDDNIFDFRTIKNTSRITAFNDEIDIAFLKRYLNAMKKSIERLVKRNMFDIHEFTRHYVNELQFDTVKSISIEESFEDFVESCVRRYMPFDYNKKDRPQKNEQIKFLKKIYSSSNKVKNGHFDGGYNEKLNYDFSVGNYAFKFIYLNKRKIYGNIFQVAKSWDFSARELLDLYRIKTIFVVNFDGDNDQLAGIYNILSKNADVLKYEDALALAEKEFNNLLE